MVWGCDRMIPYSECTLQERIERNIIAMEVCREAKQKSLENSNKTELVIGVVLILISLIGISINMMW